MAVERYKLLSNYVRGESKFTDATFLTFSPNFVNIFPLGINLKIINKQQ